MANETSKESIVFLGVDTNLFKSCFFQGITEGWQAFQLIEIDDEAENAESDLCSVLAKEGVCSVVFQATSIDASLLELLINFYNSGGLVVFFGIDGEFADPGILSRHFSLPELWRFSGYTGEPYELTSEATDQLGHAISEQAYTKSNLLSVPIQDRWMVVKAQPLHLYIAEYAGCIDGPVPNKDWKDEAASARAKYLEYCESCYQKCPLAVHKNENGGQLAYLGFVNGDDKIPLIVRALVTRRKI